MQHPEMSHCLVLSCDRCIKLILPRERKSASAFECLEILLFTFCVSVALFFRPRSFIVRKVYCKNISGLEKKSLYFLEGFFLCVCMCVRVEAGLHNHT